MTPADTYMTQPVVEPGWNPAGQGSKQLVDAGAILLATGSSSLSEHSTGLRWTFTEEKSSCLAHDPAWNRTRNARSTFDNLAVNAGARPLATGPLSLHPISNSIHPNELQAEAARSGQTQAVGAKEKQEI
ncbi:hypothetical protein C8R46DRAFT_1025925 [Mycena filopes]|nr:hypothetical protein C8R46DRAFT_1025925 [Mycena filopes]